MYATDFVYDGIRLSDCGYIVCNFDSSSGADVVSAGANIEFAKSPMHGGRKHSLVSSKYEECISGTFDICKNPDLYDPEDMYITSAEFRDIARWLNRTNYNKFYVCDDEAEMNAYYNASFNVEKILIAEKVCGIRLSMETDSPFAYGDELEECLDFDVADDSRTIYVVSDEIGYLYPDMEIECVESGDISIENKESGAITTIKNCSVGEVITINGTTKVIETSEAGHDICDDFNYDYFMLSTSLGDSSNEIIASAPCRVYLRYLPLIKYTP